MTKVKEINIKELSVLLANYEQDEPYKNGESPPDLWTWKKIQWELSRPHHGDCTNEPMTCMRCFMEEVVKKAKWILGQLQEKPLESP